MVGDDLRPRRGAKPAKSPSRKGKRARRGPSRPAALNTALRSAVESFIVSVADRAAEAVDSTWRANPAGAGLLTGNSRKADIGAPKGVPAAQLSPEQKESLVKLVGIYAHRLRPELAEQDLGQKEADRCRNFFAMGLVFWLYDRSLEPTLRYIDAKFGKKPPIKRSET